MKYQVSYFMEISVDPIIMKYMPLLPLLIKPKVHIANWKFIIFFTYFFEEKNNNIMYLIKICVGPEGDYVPLLEKSAYPWRWAAPRNIYESDYRISST